MKVVIDIKEAINKAATICSKSEKCISEIEKKLTTWGLIPEDIEKVIQWLVDEKFIDENRYTRYYVRDKFRFNHWGKIKIAHSLKQKGIPTSIIDSVLETIEPDAYRETLLEILKAKMPKVSGKNTYDRKMKLARFAQGRGFEPALIFSQIDQIWSDEDDPYEG